jgi:hypothetical protein
VGESLIAQLRATPPVTQSFWLLGVDPDADTTGWAFVHASVSTHSPPVVFRAFLGLIIPEKRGLADLQQAQAMVEAVTDFWPPNQVDPRAVFVESQRVYPTPDEEPQTRVAKANDLLRLAQVTGAVQAWAQLSYNHRKSVNPKVIIEAVAPATWKGQQRKEHTEAELVKRLDSVPVHASYVHRGQPTELDLYGHDLGNLPASCGHAIDALGIALWGLDYLALHQDKLAIPPARPFPRRPKA